MSQRKGIPIVLQLCVFSVILLATGISLIVTEVINRTGNPDKYTFEKATIRKTYCTSESNEQYIINMTTSLVSPPQNYPQPFMLGYIKNASSELGETYNTKIRVQYQTLNDVNIKDISYKYAYFKNNVDCKTFITSVINKYTWLDSSDLITSYIYSYNDDVFPFAIIIRITFVTETVMAGMVCILLSMLSCCLICCNQCRSRK